MCILDCNYNEDIDGLRKILEAQAKYWNALTPLGVPRYVDSTVEVIGVGLEAL